VTSVKDLDDAKKILSVKEATDNLITEADDLFNENKYKELYELLYPYKVMFFFSQQILHEGMSHCSLLKAIHPE
jgi:hypothetical protein